MGTTDPGIISVQYNGVTDVGDALGFATSAIGRIIQDLEAELAPLRATWNGAASSAYEVFKRNWDLKLADMAQSLYGATTLLDEMAHNYSHTDMKLAFQWQSLH